jgi:hypothetical protein
MFAGNATEVPSPGSLFRALCPHADRKMCALPLCFDADIVAIGDILTQIKLEVTVAHTLS